MLLELKIKNDLKELLVVKLVDLFDLLSLPNLFVSAYFSLS